MYVELHAHSAFSFLDGASLPDELALAAAELGYDAFALTDHDGMCGSMEFAMAAAGLGLRAIHGAEMALEDGRHVTLLVEDATGWRNLCRIVTAAHVHDRDKDEPPPRVPWTTLEEHARGPRLPERLRPRGRARRGRARAAEGCLRRGQPARGAAAARSSATTGRGTRALARARRAA